MRRWTKKLCTAALAALTALAAAGCKSQTEPLSRSGIYFDTTVTLTIYGAEKETDREGLLDACFSMCEDYEELLSRTVEGSDIYRINHSAGEPTEVSEETAALIGKALEYSRLTDGVFDCTIAPLSELWNFRGEDPQKPDGPALERALSHVGYENVTIEGTTVTLKDPEAALDLGGIAKGYIADRLNGFLEKSGVTGALIDLGGNILALGEKADGQPFRVGIRRPFSGGNDSIAAVELRGQSLVTSGVYERCFEEDGVLYHHLLNPEDGFPFTNGLLSVTILCPSSADADALATCCFGLGQEAGLRLIESLKDTEALFITEDYELHTSSGFPLDSRGQ